MSALHAIRSSSLETYHNVIAGSREDSQSQQILDLVRSIGPCTRRMIAVRLNMETSTVAARVNKLVNDKRLFEAFKKVCPLADTRRKPTPVIWVRLPQEQLDMFGGVQ